MRIPVSQPVNLEELKANLERDFPGIKCKWRAQKILVVTQPEISKSAAALVFSGKKKVTVNEGFASMGVQMLFVFIFILFGFLIPGLIYLIAFFPKQKAIRNRIGEYVRTNYAPVEVR